MRGTDYRRGRAGLADPIRSTRTGDEIGSGAAADGAAGEEERQQWPELADGKGEAAAAAGRGGGRPGRAAAAAARPSALIPC
jgi:hypothetical protein